MEKAEGNAREIKWAAALEAKFSMTESSLLLKRERQRELKKHQERIQNMKPCIDSKLGVVRESLDIGTKRQPARVRIDKDKLRQIEKQNYRLLMRLRYIHKNYSVYMPREHVYLQRGEAGRVNKPAKKPAKSEERTNTLVTSVSQDNHFVDEEMANQVAAMNLWQK